MGDPFLAEIRIFPFDRFAPKGWAWCDGQQMPVSQNTALFSLLGSTYGGDGKSSFALPNLQGRAPMHPGQGPGLTPRDLGETGGSDTVTLLVSEVPAHAHALNAQGSNANLNDPKDAVLARPFGGGEMYRAPAGEPVDPLADQSITPTGGDQPHNNLMPYLTLCFCIALQGTYPSRG